MTDYSLLVKELAPAVEPSLFELWFLAEPKHIQTSRCTALTALSSGDSGHPRLHRAVGRVYAVLLSGELGDLTACGWRRPRARAV
jgi:hypothetical protein